MLTFRASRPVVLLLAALGALLSASAATPSTGAARPNIIFILADDLGYGDVGAFFAGGARASGPQGGRMTPQLDRLAATGARLTDHYCAAPVCAPSRASLLTGRHQGHATVRNNQFDKALEANHTLATVLRQAGYATAAFGKWGLQGRAEGAAPNWPAHPLNRGFDFYFGYIRHADGHEHYPKEAPYRNRNNSGKKKKAAPAGDESDDASPQVFGKEVWENRRELSATLDKCYTTDLFTARTKQWITAQQQANPGQPFFAYLAYDTPHAVLELPTMAYPAGGGLKGGVQWLGRPGRMINTAEGTIDSWTHPDFAQATYDDDRDPATPPKPWPEVYQRYATSVRRIDDAVADLVQLLRDLNVAENTLLVFSSDNGPSLESYLREPYSPEFFSAYGPFDGVKRDLWEGGTRVPTLAWWPARIPAGRTVAAPGAHWDWLPTFAAASGLAVPALADGVSLLPSLTGTGESPRGPLYFEYQQDGRTPDFPAFSTTRRNRQRRQMQSLRLGNHVAVRYDVKAATDPFEIYDVAQDPKQTRDLAREPAGAALQERFQAATLQSRRPDAAAPRPYDEALVPPVSGPAKPGVEWQLFPGAFPWVPATTGLRPGSSGQAATIDLAALRAPKGPFAAQFTGHLVVPQDGEYTFVAAADTAVIVRLHDAVLLDCDFGYPAGTERTSTARLKAGLHPIRVSYRHSGDAAPRLRLEWSGPGVARQPLAAGALHR